MRQMESLEDERGRLPVIPLKKQEQAIRQIAVSRGLVLTELYRDNERDEAFHRLKQDTVCREFDTLIFYSLFCFGLNIYSAADFIRDVLIPGGFRVIAAEDGFCMEGKAKEASVAYVEEKRYAHRQLYSNVARDQKLKQRTRQKEAVGQRPMTASKENRIPPALEKIVGRREVVRGRRCVPGKAELLRRKDVQEQMKEHIRKERYRALYAKEALTALAERREKRLSEYRKQQERIFQEMLKLNSKVFILNQKKKNKEDSEDDCKRLMERIEGLEVEMKQCRRNIKDILLLFSEENPWIKLFTGARLKRVLKGELTPGLCRQWVTSWYAVKAEEMTVVVCGFSYEVWKEALMLEFFEADEGWNNPKRNKLTSVREG